MELEKRSQVLLLFLSEATGPYPNDQVRIMKGQFLLSRLQQLLEGEYDFIPYSYGPFDSQVYRDINSLWLEDLIDVRGDSGSTRIHTLTLKGEQLVRSLRTRFDPFEVEQIRAAHQRVSGKPFRQMLEDIYQEFPAFRENSVLV